MLMHLDLLVLISKTKKVERTDQLRMTMATFCA